MGRGKGDPARSKLRASSGSVAASLLNTPATSSVGFGGFVGSARVDSALSVDGELPLDVEGDVALHLKRLSKKDPTTKLKALTALTLLFEERSGAELSAILPLWVFEYKRLVQDSSRQVRQNAHLAMTSLVSSVGRGLAPHLRSLMGPWWVAQFDPSREVLEAAQTSFQVAFSGQKKRLESLMYCQNEIFSHLDDNLRLSPETISDKATPIEESTEKHERVVSCSLLALAALVDVLVGPVSTSSGQENSANNVNGESNAKTRDLVREAATNLCWNHKFLRQYVKAKSSRLRSSSYQALRSFIQYIPEVFREEDMDVVGPSILGTFAEKDPACHQAMWDVILLFAKGFPQVWGAKSVNKSVLSKLWVFLQRGCYGSQQISYPYLLPLISLIPPKAIVPIQNCLLEFFKSLWKGLYVPQVGPKDRVALMKALQECLGWTVLNAKRFSDAEGYEAIQLQTALIDGVLLKLMWQDFVGQNMPLSTSSADSNPATDFSEPALSKTGSDGSVPRISSEQIAQELVSCMVHIIQTLSQHDDKIMCAFWGEFQASCVQIVQDAGNLWSSVKEEDWRIARITEFYKVLGTKALKGRKREGWSLTHAVRPFVAKSFPGIRSLGNPGSITLMAKLISIYGPTGFSQLSVSSSLNRIKDQTSPDPQVQDLEAEEDLLKFFREELVPWCLDGKSGFTGPKTELILAFIESDRFQGEWDFVISHLTVWQEDKEERIDAEQVGVLATLLEKVRERMDCQLVSEDQRRKETSCGIIRWKSPRIDGAALAVASSGFLAHPACLQLLRSALGGTSAEQVVSPIVLENTAIQILEKLLFRLLGVLSGSTMNWIKSTPLVIMDLQANDYISLSDNQEATEGILQLAVSAINVIESCIFLLPTLQNSNTVGVKLTAAIFCLNWAYSGADITTVDDNYDSGDEYDTDLESDEDIDGNDSLLEVAPELKISRDIYSSGIAEDDPPSKIEQGCSSLRDAVLSVRHRISPSFCRGFSALARFRLRECLIKCLRLAVLDEEFESRGQTAARCAIWAHEVAAYTCEGPDEVSQFVDYLLASLDCWPQWVIIPSIVERHMHRDIPTWKHYGLLSNTEIQRHGQFAAFVDNLCRKLSPQEVFFISTAVSDTKINTEDTSVNKSQGTIERGQESSRIWLVIELLCTWEWPGGTALNHVLPFLWSFARANKDSMAYNLLWGTIEGLFLGETNLRAKITIDSFSGSCEDDMNVIKSPFLQALLHLLKGLLEKEDGWRNVDARHLFRQYVSKQEAVDFVSPFCDVQILPHVLGVLMPILRKRSSDSTGGSSDEEWEDFLQTAVSVWSQKALMTPPLVAIDEVSGDQWIQVAVACFPLNPAGGTAAMASASSAPVTSQERELLLSLFRRQFSREAIAAVAALAAAERNLPDQVRAPMKSGQLFEVTLAKLIAAAIGYCWVDFGNEDWEFVLRRLRGWLQEAVIEVEEFAEGVVNVVKGSQENPEAKDIVTKLENVVFQKEKRSELSSIAVAIFSLLKGLTNLAGADSTDSSGNIKVPDWEILEMRAMEDILRMLLSVGLAESTGKSVGEVIAQRRKLDGQLWDNVADVALSSSGQAREAAIRAVDLWGLGNGAISSLYALLFSAQPTISLQWVAYQFLSTHPLLRMAVTYGVVLEETKIKVEDEAIDDGETKVEEVKGDDAQQIPASGIAQIRPELASILETSRSVIVGSPLTDSVRVSFLLGWSVLLTRLQSLQAISSTRKRLVQYVQDSDISPTLLDCLFQHIPLNQNIGTSGARKRTLAAGVKTSSAAAAAKRAAATGSLAFAVEGLWPVQKESLVTLAGALYGLMLLVLPACVRIWFTGLRDKSLALAMEAFTTIHCSPQLLADEFFQVQSAAVDEENLTIRANRSLREVTAIYKKEEAGMDIVIRIPPCYPLRAVDVECTRRMGIGETLLRKWILSMAAFLRNQNGAVAEAVQLWKKNVDREFDGVEECPICYSIIHTSNHSLPRLACKTCRHKFHSACLYKWFATSHQSTCPLCKSNF